MSGLALRPQRLALPGIGLAAGALLVLLLAIAALAPWIRRTIPWHRILQPRSPYRLRNTGWARTTWDAISQAD